jgi:hypothetical protein
MLSWELLLLVSLSALLLASIEIGRTDLASVELASAPEDPHMAFANADVVPNLGEGEPFKVVFRQGLTVLSEWQVNFVKEGEEQIVRVLRTLGNPPRGC